MPGHILVSCLLTVRDVVLIGFNIWNWCFALETLTRDDGLRETRTPSTYIPLHLTVDGP